MTPAPEPLPVIVTPARLSVLGAETVNPSLNTAFPVNVVAPVTVNAPSVVVPLFDPDIRRPPDAPAAAAGTAPPTSFAVCAVPLPVGPSLTTLESTSPAASTTIERPEVAG